MVVVHVQTQEKWTFCIVLCRLLSNIFIVLCEVLPDSFVKETVHQVDFKHDSKQISSECSGHPCIKSWLLCMNEKLTNYERDRDMTQTDRNFFCKDRR